MSGVRTNLYGVPSASFMTVEVRVRPSHIEVREDGRAIARHERCYDINGRFSDSSTTWMYWNESLARWSDRNRSPSGGKKDFGQTAMTGYSPR